MDLYFEEDELGDVHAGSLNVATPAPAPSLPHGTNVTTPKYPNKSYSSSKPQILYFVENQLNVNDNCESHDVMLCELNPVDNRSHSSFLAVD